MITRAADHHLVRPDPAAEAPAVVEVAAGGPFVVVMRDDTALCVREFGHRLGIRGTAAASGLAEAYHGFQHDTRDALRAVARYPGGLVFHVVDPLCLEEAVRRRAGDGPLISLDPLVERGVAPLRVSRGFLLGGREAIGLVPRPGAAPVAEQIAALPRDPAGAGCTLVEDDICTGETVAAVVRLLGAAGRRVHRVVPGVRLDAAACPAVPGAVLDPVLEYRTTGGAPGARAVELADPRNFLLGLSGLVVRLPDGTWGRAPYWLPFVRTSARAGVPADRDEEFALRVLGANVRFFERAERLAGRPVLVGDLHPAVRRLLESLRLADAGRPVRPLIGDLASGLGAWTERIAAHATGTLTASAVR
ncbi:hypothetical protein [Streptantibioticus silvisoli]|uniref:Phosphoribosyltransferase n=1 Tax=Streptantibioticus silvisoli TaxID=2705255 RepID=A0ABT6VSN0_9ACTN|nr:hypothetical protein [Streptantibioticus silvisoli]MDI5961478.1 hypothetical protein [Streptantibioticus silvisoli]